METTKLPTRALLEGVERIHFYEGDSERCPEDITFPSVMRVLMESLGENLGCKHHRPTAPSWGLGCAYSYFTGVSGMAFAVNWAPGWQEGTYAMMDNLPGGRVEACRKAFDAVGYGCEFLPKEAGEQALREKIQYSVAGQHRPVVGFGVISGPPETAIITGYDQDGETLLGWSFFQNEPGVEKDPSGCFRKTGWFADTNEGILLVGEKGPVPEQGEVFKRALAHGLKILDTPQANGVATGLAAYDAWAADLSNAESFVDADEAVLRKRYDLHNFLVGQIAEVRWYGAVWIVDTYEKAHFRLSEPLLKAAACWAGEHELMWQMWDLAGGIMNQDGWRKLGDPAVRARMVQVVQECHAKDAEAAEYIREALKRG